MSPRLTRLTRPLVRRYLLNGTGKPGTGEAQGDWVDVDWEKAIDLVARKLAELKNQAGPDAIGVLASAKCGAEDGFGMIGGSAIVAPTGEIAAQALRITAPDLKEMAIIDEIIPEPDGGAHRDHDAAASMVDKVLFKYFNELIHQPVQKLLDGRYNKFRQMAHFFTE